MPWLAIGAVQLAREPIPVETQQAQYWCWLAVAVAVDRNRGGEISQGQLANAIFGESTCCTDPHSIECDREGSVKDALIELGRHRATIALGEDAPDRSALIAELESDRPPVAQIDFGFEENHVVLLAGYGIDSVGNELVSVGDPSEGWNAVDVVWDLADRYRGGVAWTHVCLTS